MAATRDFVYHAFISYSHAGDRELAQMVQSSLENFARPIFRGRSMRVYRDETNLSARPDLWSAIENALNGSRKLILLASPWAAQSEWIPREVQHFVKTRGHDNVCIVQTMGELPWTSSPGTFRSDSQEAAMPVELLELLQRPGVEPLVVDLRAFRQATTRLTRAARAEYESKIAALAAELLGRDKDEIYGEHLRRQRRTLAIAVCAAVLLLVLAAIAVYESLQSSVARDLAEQKRVLAEAGRADAILDEPWRWATGLAVALEASLVARSPKDPLPLELVGALVRGAWQATPYEVLDMHSRRATAAISSDGMRILTLGADALHLWDAPFNRSVRLPLSPEEDVLSVSLAPDGRRIATLVDGPVVRIRDDAGKVIQHLSVHTGAVLSVSFSPPHGERVMTAGEDDSVWISSVSDGQARLLYRGESDSTFATYSPDGARALVIEDGTIPRVLEVSSGGLLTLLGDEGWWKAHPGRVISAAFSATGELLVTTGDDQNVRVWDANSGTHLAAYAGHAGPVNAASFSRDGGRVVSAGEDMSVRVWDRARSIHTVLLGHSGPVGAVFFLADGKHVLSAADDRTVRIWDASPERAFVVLRGQIRAKCGQFAAAAGTRIVTVDGKTLRLWSSSTAESLDSLPTESDHIESASFSPDGRRIVTAADSGLIESWDLERNARRLPSFGDRAVRLYSASFSPNGQWIVTAGRTRTTSGRGAGLAQVWRADTGRLERSFTGHVGPVYTAVFSPDGSRIVTAGADASVRLWDVRTGLQLNRLDGHTKYVNTACFSPDGTRIVSGSDDGTARIWDARNGKELAILEGHSDAVQSAFFARDDATLFTASDDHSVAWWRTSTGERLTHIDLGDDAHGIAGALDSQRILVTMANETWIGSISAEDAMRRGCEILRRLSAIPQVSEASLEAIHRECDAFRLHP